MAVTYKQAGVDIVAGDRVAAHAKASARGTHRREVVSGIGGFGGMFRVPSGYRKPVMVTSTDSAGTKVKIAFAMNKHDTIGIDVVAMNVNDILTVGAEPIAFLDYFATGKLDTKVVNAVVRGVARGCKESGCALIGGETAELPSLYAAGEYDIAGFTVGVVEESKIIDGRRIRPRDVLIGLPSNGIHSNGYSLVRHICFEVAKLSLHSRPPELKGTLAQELIRPTRIYVRQILKLPLSQVTGMAHITGGGLPSKLGRIIPDNLVAEVRLGSWPILPVFKMLQRLGKVALDEMLRTFNMGVGYVVVVPPRHVDNVMAALKRQREKAFILGAVRRAKKGEKNRVAVG